MKECIFTAHCTEPVCDKSCPILAETSYLLERNNISMDSQVFNVPEKDLNSAVSAISKIEISNNKLGVIISNDTINTANLLTYCAICQNWKGNRLHCNVYNLKFSNHVEAIQRSWSSKSNSDSLEYEQIWATTSKILIISNIDFVQFKDFQAQTMLNLIHSRIDNNLTTIVVTPKLQSLVGTGQFFNHMQSILGKAVIKWQ
jgi:hypothetical protein